MRWVICAVAMLALTPSALAADLDDIAVLRGPQVVGPPSFTRWSGFYFGGSASYSSGSADFTNASQPLLGYSLRELELESVDQPSSWPILGQAWGHSSGFGAFAGYNTQFQDVVLGLEADYTHSPFSVVAAELPISRVVTAGSNLYSVNVSGSASMEVTDFGSLRARAGWVFNNFLPYGFAGVAFGRGTYAVSTLVAGQQNSTSAASPIIPCDPATVATCVDYAFANSNGQGGVLLYGFSVGGGLDVALTPNIFLRGEFEYIQFAPVASIVAAVSTARVGAGFKF